MTVLFCGIAGATYGYPKWKTLPSDGRALEDSVKWTSQDSCERLLKMVSLNLCLQSHSSFPIHAPGYGMTFEFLHTSPGN
mmetsp:Transcript_78199/g.135600  ORF Transcript_78199/g.135600 Transcript_78199/m.135600 type:complete len:80 (+) Transcript_78199:439-678(+)